jgi:hypothetical protein
VLGTPETRSASREIGDIVIFFVPNCGKIDDNDLVSNSFSFPTKYIIHFDISICDVVIMEIFDCFTNFYEDQPCNIPKVVSFVLVPYVLHYFRVSFVAVIEFFPDHDLS